MREEKIVKRKNTSHGVAASAVLQGLADYSDWTLEELFALRP
jgi:hypothetical protein